jgi:hypothetical protein
MNAKPLVQLMPACLAMILIAGWASQTLGLADSTNPTARPLRYEEPALLTGTIYAKNSRKILFKFKRVGSRSGAKLSVLREYTYPDGKPAARERVIYNEDDLVSYALDELQIGAAGSASIRREPGNRLKGTVLFDYTKDVASGGKHKTSTEAWRSEALIGDMVAPFLVAHWAELAKGDKVKCRYVVVPRRETVGFTFVKDSESTYQGRKVVMIRMEATSPFIAALVDPLYFTVEKESPHRVYQVVGRVTPKVKVGNGWEDLDAVTVFDWPSR